MVSPTRVSLALALFLGLGSSCRPYRQPPAIDAEMASCIPPDTVAVAGLNLDQLRSTSLYRSRAQRTEAFREASYLLIASNGKDLLLVARGEFRHTPSLATRLTPTLVVAGSADLVQRAQAQHRSKNTGAPRLFEVANGIAGGKPIWVVADGGVTLPLSGNATNLNRVLHFTDYVTLTAQIGPQVDIDAAGVCRTAEDSLHLEESVRAFLTFAGAAGSRSIIHQATIRREDRIVHTTVSISLQSAEELLHAAIP